MMIYIYAAIALVIGVQQVAIHHYRSAYLVEEKAHDADNAMASALADQQKSHNIEIKAAQTTLQNEKDAQHAQLLNQLTGSLNAANARLLNASKAMASSGVSRPGFTAQVCADQAGNDRLRETLQRTQRQLGEAIAEYQRGIGERLVGPAGKNTASLIIMQDWAEKQRGIK